MENGRVAEQFSLVSFYLFVCFMYFFVKKIYIMPVSDAFSDPVATAARFNGEFARIQKV